nr:MAG TPA: hypothetical protein [Caudoviricetes sp.]
MSLRPLMNIESISDIIINHSIVCIDFTSDIFSQYSFIYRGLLFCLSLNEYCRFFKPLFSCIF